MHTLIAKIISFSLIGLTVATAAHAQVTNPITIQSLTGLLLAIIDTVIILAVPVVVIAVVYAGFLFVSAGGNETKLSSAKRIFFWALVGGLILFGARVIADVICNTVAGISVNLTCP